MIRFRIDASGLWVVGGSLGAAVLTVIGFRIVGQLVGAAVFGQGILLYGVVLLIAGLGAGPIAQAVGKYYFDAKGTTDQVRLLASAALLVAVAYLAGVCVLTGLTVYGWIPGFSVAALLAVALTAEMLRSIWSAWLQSQARFRPVAIALLADAALRPVLVVLFSQGHMPGLHVLLMGYALAALVSVGVLTTRGLRGLVLVRPCAREMRKLRTFGMPLVGNSLFGWLSNSGDRYLIAAALDLTSAGIYVAASALGGRISLLIGNMFETYYRPLIYAAIADRNKQALLSACRHWAIWLLLVGVCALFTLWIAAAQIQEFLLAPEFRKGAPPVIALSFCAFLLVAFGFIPQRISYALERTGYVATTEVVGTVLMGASVLILGNAFGLNGAAAGMVIAAGGRLLLAILLARRSMRQSQTELL